MSRLPLRASPHDICPDRATPDCSACPRGRRIQDYCNCPAMRAWQAATQRCQSIQLADGTIA